MIFERFTKAKKNPEDETPIVSASETGAVSRMIDVVGSRPEYVMGKEKLHCDYTFSTGEILKATEDENGFARIVIMRNGKPIIDFNDLLPEYSFITPTHAASLSGQWGMLAERKLIFVGDMLNPKNIVALLHEIGHGKDFQKNTNNLSILNLLNFSNSFFPNMQKAHDIAERCSSMERNAWAEAMKIIRMVKRDHNVNMMEIFDDFNEFRDIMNAALLTHRIAASNMLASTAAASTASAGFWSSVRTKLAEKLWGENQDNEEWQFLETLFDKNRLK